MIRISIDLSKIDKQKIKHHVNGGKYYDMILSELQKPDNYGNTHTLYESQTAADREISKSKNYLGKGKAITAKDITQTPAATENIDDDLPF